MIQQGQPESNRIIVDVIYELPDRHYPVGGFLFANMGRNMKNFILFSSVIVFILCNITPSAAGPFEDFLASEYDGGSHKYTLTGDYFVDTDLNSIEIKRYTYPIIDGQGFVLSGLYEGNKKHKGMIIGNESDQGGHVMYIYTGIKIQNFDIPITNYGFLSFVDGETVFSDNDNADIINNGTTVIVGDVYLDTGIFDSNMNAESGITDIRGGILYLSDDAQIKQQKIGNIYGGINGTLSAMADNIFVSDKIEHIILEWRGGTNINNNIENSDIHIAGNTINNADLDLHENMLSFAKNTEFINNATLDIGYLTTNVEDKVEFGQEPHKGMLNNNGTLYVGGLKTEYLAPTVEITGNGTTYIFKPSDEDFDNPSIFENGVITQNKVILTGGGHIRSTVINSPLEIQTGKIDGASIINDETHNVGNLEISPYGSYNLLVTFNDIVKNDGNIDITSGVTFNDQVINTGTLNAYGFIQNEVKFKEVINSGLLDLTSNIGGTYVYIDSITGDTLNIDTNKVNISNGSVAINKIENQNIFVDGTMELMDSIVNSKLQIGYGTLQANASNLNLIDGIISNNGHLVFTGGTNTNAISGTGNVEIRGIVENKAKINQELSIRYDGQLTSCADILLGNISNLGILNLSGGTIVGNISGAINIFGDTTFAGTLVGWLGANMYANVNLTNNTVYFSNFTVNNNTKLNFTNNVMRDATIQVFNGGIVNILSADMRNTKIIINDDMIHGGIISTGSDSRNKIEINDGGIVNISDTNSQGTNFSINKGGILNADAGSLSIGVPNSIIQPRIDNAGTINISDGDLLSPIYGDGTANIMGNVKNTGYISNSIQITNSGQFTTAANKFHKDVLNDGILNLTGEELVTDISGAGITNINGIVNINSDITNLQSTTVAHGAALDIRTANVNVSDILINGDLKLTLKDLTPYSTEYVGGKLNVINDLTIGTDARLLFTFDSSVKLNKGEYTGNLSLITVGGDINGSWADVLSNNRYSINETPDKGTFEIIYIKDADEVVASAGGSKNNANTAIAWDSLTGVYGQTEFIRQKLNDLSQHDAQTYVKTLEQIAPTHAQVVLNTTRTINSLINKQITERLNVISGHNGGDSNNIGAGLWTQGFINHSAQTGASEYNGNTYGIAVGGDIVITNDIKAGIAYIFNSTDADATERTINATGHNFALYGQYTLSQLALNALVSYGFTSYTDDAQLVYSEYKSNNLGLNISADYAFSDNWTGFAGARYLMVSQDKYTDSIGQQININDNNILTLGLGGKYSNNIEVFGLVFNPVISAALTYDVLNSEHTAIVNIANAVYQITGDTIDPLGLEIGLALEKSIGNWNFGLKYDLELHSNFSSHTGQIIFRYAF